MVCPNCGASIQVDADKKNLTCNYCGNSIYIDDEVQHVQYDNAEETGYQFEKGRQRAQAEARQFTAQQYRGSVQQPPVKKRKTWLWVLGWIFIFPLPLTILLLRKKEMNPVLKYGIIAVAWIIYLAIGFAGRSNDGNKDTSSNETTISTETNDNITTDNDSTTSDTETTQVVDNSTESSEEGGKLLLSDITYVELDALQKLFVDLPTFVGRDDVNAFIKDNGFHSHKFTGDKEYYIGLTAASVSSRPRDREGAVIEVIYDNDGNISQVGYTIGGSVGFFKDFELTYENGKFHYDGEAAMQLYLANKGYTNAEVTSGAEDGVDTFINSINANDGINLDFVEDFVPSDKNSGHYKTEFRLNAYKDALGKSYKYEDTTVDIILSSTGSIKRIYMDAATYEQCENMIRYASALLDSTATESDIQEAIDYIGEHKSANGYYYAKLGLLMLGGGDKGYEFMLKLD